MNNPFNLIRQMLHRKGESEVSKILGDPKSIQAFGTFYKNNMESFEVYELAKNKNLTDITLLDLFKRSYKEAVKEKGNFLVL